MGYVTTLREELTITPPLRWSSCKDDQQLGIDRARYHHKGVYLVEDRETVETDDGPLERRTAARVRYAWGNPEKLYDIVEELQALVDRYPDHEFTGEFLGQGADFGDIWKLHVTAGRKVERVLPTITWPDGTVLVNRRY